MKCLYFQNFIPVSYTHLIETLERKLGQPLFIRSTKKVQLTPAGALLLKHVEPAMNLIDVYKRQRGDNHSLPQRHGAGKSDGGLGKPNVRSGP